MDIQTTFPIREDLSFGERSLTLFFALDASGCCMSDILADVVVVGWHEHCFFLQNFECAPSFATNKIICIYKCHFNSNCIPMRAAYLCEANDAFDAYMYVHLHIQ